jgi:ribonuclease HII
MHGLLVGLDECGMGSWAGPMTAAVVVIASDKVPVGVRDSKKITPVIREDLSAEIMAAAEYYKIVYRTVEDIDTLGISDCWLSAIRELAIAARLMTLPQQLTMILDGSRWVELPYVASIPKADAKFPAVSAASILAKCHQCGWMDDLHLLYPRYQFCAHHGYGTADHLRLLKEHGPCPAHRRSYKPIKKLIHSLACGSKRS